MNLDDLESREIIQVCERLHAEGWLAACDGNVSLRLPESKRTPTAEVLITPAGLPKAWLNPGDLVRVTLAGQAEGGHRLPSSETPMHLEIYRKVPQARAVVHAHPPYAIAWTVGRPELTELPNRSCSELILALGRVPFVPYARTGTKAMGEVLVPYLPKHRALLLRNHGALVWGESLEEAYLGMERLEHSAKLLYFAATLAGSRSLPELPAEEVAELEKLRAQIGDRIL